MMLVDIAARSYRRLPRRWVPKIDVSTLVQLFGRLLGTGHHGVIANAVLADNTHNKCDR